MTPSRTATFTASDLDENARPSSPSLALLLECQRPAGGGARAWLHALDTLDIRRGDTRSFSRTRSAGVLALPDRYLSGSHARFARAGGRWRVEDLGSRNGTLLNGTRLSAPAELKEGDVVEVGQVFLRFRAADTVPDGDPDWQEISPDAPVDPLATLVPVVAESLHALEAAARGGLPVLLQGETGTGKEVHAARVHALSGREGAFVPVNCGALPANLVEGQLFGHARGAFTGAARDEPGLVRASDGGTLFLDEIGDLPAPAQAALLRVLQEKEVLPVGAARPVRVDLRVVAATHRRLDLAQARGEFRPDLYARLAGYTHVLRPLRERLDDLGILLPRLLPARADGWRLAPETTRALLAHAWPLNIRELQQALVLAATLCTDGLLRVTHLPESVRFPAPVPPPAAPRAVPSRPAPPDDDVLREHLVALLTQHKGNISEVSRELGKARMQVHRWMKRFGLDPESFRS